MLNYYKIAGRIVQMDSFGRTEAQALPYRIHTNDEPEITVVSEFDRARRDFKTLSDSDVEYIASGANFYKHLLDYNGLMLHSSAVVMDGKAYLFTADSGGGKSTHTSLWRQVFGDERVRMLNDDKPALCNENGSWFAYGTPWCGKTGQNANLRAPVAGIAVIEKSEHNKIELFVGTKAIITLMRQANKPNDADARGKMMGLLDSLLQDVPVWKMKCNMDPEAAIVSYEAMSGRKFEEL